MALARRALSRSVGRRAHVGRRVSRDPTDDSSALRRAFGNRSDERAAGRTESGRSRACAGNISCHKNRREISKRRGRNFCTTDSPRTFSCATSRRLSTATPRAALRTHFGRRLRRQRRNRPRSCSSEVTQWMTAVTPTTAGLQEMPDPVTKLTWDNAALVSPAIRPHTSDRERRLDPRHRYRQGQRPEQ